jgi:ribosomal 50S subunit-associated protein YjgA (DUF615 family)
MMSDTILSPLKEAPQRRVKKIDEVLAQKLKNRHKEQLAKMIHVEELRIRISERGDWYCIIKSTDGNYSLQSFENNFYNVLIGLLKEVTQEKPTKSQLYIKKDEILYDLDNDSLYAAHEAMYGVPE